MPLLRSAWRTASDLDPKSPDDEALKLQLGGIEYVKLAKECLVLRCRMGLLEWLNESVECEVGMFFISGRRYLLLRVDFSDGVEWIARIRKPHTEIYIDKTPAEAMANEIVTMNLVRSRTTIPVPRVFGFDVSTDNPARARYMVMELLPGACTSDSFSKTIPRHLRDKVALNLASYYYQLSRIRFPRMAEISPPRARANYAAGMQLASELGDEVVLSGRNFATPQRLYEAYTYALDNPQPNRAATDEFVYRDPVHTMKHGPLWALFRLRASDFAVRPEFLDGPFVLCHQDMCRAKVLFDNDFNITGILGWNDLSTGPRECFAANKEFVEDDRLAAAVGRNVAVLAKAQNDVFGEKLEDSFVSPYPQLAYRCLHE